MAYNKMKRGWFGQSERHSLSARGIKNAQNGSTASDKVFAIPEKFTNARFKLSYITGGLPNEFAAKYFRLLSRQKQNHVATVIRGRDGNIIAGSKAHAVEHDFRVEMDKIGVRFDSDWRNDYRSWHTSQFRLTNRQTNNPAGRKGKYLSWEDWVKVNNSFNKVMDKHGISSNVKTLGGKFVVRRGTSALTMADWETAGEENVGSTFNPVARKNKWR